MRWIFALTVALSACAPREAGEGEGEGDSDVVIVDESCAVDGCLRAVSDLGAFDREALTPFVAATVHLDNGYRVFTIEYATDGRSSTATVTLPIDLEGDAPDDGFAVVVNAHGTVGLDDACRLSGTVSGSGLAGLFGARGSIGVAPDYVGLGTAGLSPYLDTESEGAAVLDGIRAATNLARLEGVAVNGRSAVVGLSQGGHAVLAAAAMHDDYAPELDVRAFGATAPANVYEEQWRPGLTFAGPHVAFYAMLAWSWSREAGVADDVDRAIWAVDVEDSIDDIMAGTCVWSPTFTNELVLETVLGDEPRAVFSAEFIDAFTSGDWGRFGFMRDRFAQNRVVPFVQSAPLRIWQGTADTVVLPSMTEALVDDLRAGGVDVEFTVVDGGTHIDTAFGFVAFEERATAESVGWINEQLQR